MNKAVRANALTAYRLSKSLAEFRARWREIEFNPFSERRVRERKRIFAQASLCRYECGETEAPASVLLKYTDFFDVSSDYIFGRTDDPHGISFDCKPRYTDPEWEQFIEMCFDPKSPMNARLKQSLKDMMRDENKNDGE